MDILYAVAIGCILDLLFGDPKWLPHPICFLGWLIKTGEKIIRRLCKSPKSEYICGAALTLSVVAITFIIPFVILFILVKVNAVATIIVQAYMCFQIMAARSLKTESMRVYKELKKQDIIKARKMLSWIVSRDTEALDEQGISKSTVETISENTSDGVIAPLIFMLIGGAPMGFLYKAINTLDSMIGYKNERYIYFGRFAAKLDDLANYLPARISAFFMIIASFICGYNGMGAIKIYNRDKKNHTSPNSAQTESVCAGALNIQIAGPNYYFGRLINKSTIGDAVRPIEAEDIKRANRLMYCAFIIALIVGLAIRFAIVRG